MTPIADRAIHVDRAPSRRIERILHVLGAPQRRVSLRSERLLPMQRSHWECGCTLDVAADGRSAFAWHTCVEHCDLAGGASLLAQAAH